MGGGVVVGGVVGGVEEVGVVERVRWRVEEEEAEGVVVDPRRWLSNRAHRPKEVMVEARVGRCRASREYPKRYQWKGQLSGQMGKRVVTNEAARVTCPW